MVTVRECEVDGVPCFWVETGRPTLAARLLFRQGSADEPLHESGWLHLLEHMAMHGVGNGSLQVNGSVSPLLTTFDAHGPADDVAHHLTRLATWLGNPVLHGVERERGVLRAESELRGGPVVRSLRSRFGATGPGVASYGEPGLARATPEVLWDRCRRVFNRGNAVLVLDGPPPPRLRLALAEGSFLPPVPAQSVETQFPLAYEEPAGLVISGVVARSHDAGVAASLLEKALRQEVRERAGAGYAPWSVYEPVDADTAVIAAGSDLRPEVLPTILERSLVLLERQRSGAPSAWLEEQVSARLQSLRDPYNAMGIALRAAHAVLNDQLPPSYDELVAETAGTDRERVRTAFDQLHASLLLGAPARTKLPQRVRTSTFPRTRPWPAAGSHRHRNWPLDRTRFAAGPAGVQLTQGDDALQAPLDEIAGLLSYRDGTRHIVRHDGWAVTMQARQWHDGPRLTRVLDEVVPPHLHLPLEGDGGRDFRRQSWWRRWYPPLRRGLRSAPGLAMVAVVFALIAVAASTQQAAVVSGACLVVAFLCLFRVPAAYLRGRRRLW